MLISWGPRLLLRRQDRAAPDLPSAWDSNASIFAVATLSCVSEFEADFALGRDKFIVYGRQRSPLVRSSQCQQAGPSATVSELLVMLDPLVRPCQHKHNTTILPTPRQRLPFHYQCMCGMLQSFGDWCRHSLLTRRRQQKCMSRSAFPFAIPNSLEQISFQSFRDIHPHPSATQVRLTYYATRTHYAYVRSLT